MKFQEGITQTSAKAKKEDGELPNPSFVDVSADITNGHLVAYAHTSEMQIQKETPASVSRTTYAGRLIEYITGVKLDDPNLPERLQADQDAIRGKYQLPPREIRFDQPGEYERILREIAREHNIQIALKSECGTFFIVSPVIGGVFFDQDKRIGVDVDRTNNETHSEGLAVLEHELIHGLQHEYSPRMPIELMEYEAYIAGANLNHIHNMDEDERIESLNAFIEFSIGGSVRHWYASVSEAGGKEELPVWDNAEYFANKK